MIIEHREVNEENLNENLEPEELKGEISDDLTSLKDTIDIQNDQKSLDRLVNETRDDRYA